MDLCSNGHDEVCYDGRVCPACVEQETATEALKERDELRANLDRAQQRIEELEDELSDNAHC